MGGLEFLLFRYQYLRLLWLYKLSVKNIILQVRRMRPQTNNIAKSQPKEWPQIVAILIGE